MAGFKVYGQVTEAENQRGIPDLIVDARDADLFYNDLLGSSKTDQAGSFSIECLGGDSPKVGGNKIDLYLVVKSGDGKVLQSTRGNVILGVENDVEINVAIKHSVLAGAGLAPDEPAEQMEDVDPATLRRFTTWTFQPGYDPREPVLEQIQQDLGGKASILELFRQYMDELRTNPDNNAVQIVKMARLFQLGLTPDTVEGHFYGVPVCMRTGDQEGGLASVGNILEILWGATLDRECPWVGKTFTADTAGKVESITSGQFKPQGKAFIGINHFHEIELKALNILAFHVLDLWMSLKPAPPEEQKAFDYEKNGGNFVAAKDLSVYSKTNREVFQLNYRWKNLGNRVPLCWLVDELVQIAEGLYLGQLLFSTRRLLRDYDPQRPVSDYEYQHFGYFLLFDESWNMEARRLFAYLEIPVTAPGMVHPAAAGSFDLSKFSTFTFEEPPPAVCNDDILALVRADMKDKPTIMHLMKDYSDRLQGGLDNDSPYFQRLHEIFNRGIGIEDMKGHYRGALVSWHSEGMFKLFGINTINLAWMSLARQFSPWTGKSFEDISTERLQELTDGFEKGKPVTRWGSNTQSYRTFKQKFIGRLAHFADVWTETAPPDEALIYGYDVKNFFFISHQAESLNEDCKGKTIYQFNYRWPKLKTIIPDCYCIDEVVQIAEGLYLGQLMYATEVLKPYDPAVEPSLYKYANFGYFLLMDDEWHQIRLQIGFDLTDV